MIKGLAPKRNGNEPNETLLSRDVSEVDTDATRVDLNDIAHRTRYADDRYETIGDMVHKKFGAAGSFY